MSDEYAAMLGERCRELEAGAIILQDEIARLRDRVSGLGAAIRAIVSAYDSFEASSIENADVSTMLALTGTVQAIGRAEAILGVRSQAAPKETCE